MSIFEYDEEKHLKNEREFGYQRGHEAGVKEGESRVNALNLKLIESGRESEIIKAATDKAYQEKLFKEFNL